VTPIRETIAKAIPPELRIGTAAGIGIFLTFIGLKNAGLIAADPVTFVKLGTLDRHTLFGAVGMLVTVLLIVRRSPLAFLAGIFVVTAITWLAGEIKIPERIVASPDFHTVFLKLDILGALKLSLLPVIIGIMFTDLFDSISTFIGVAHAAELLDENGNPRNLRQGLIVDSLATFGAGVAGTSSGTAYIESVAGINSGGRTGLTSVFTALCFLPCFFLAPLAGMVPLYATAPVLILVGAAMFIYQFFARRPTPELANYAVPGAQGLYLSGPFMHPGGGLTGGGRATAIRILEDLKVRYSHVMTS
jgi:AGZA family xanthine/uracil permease-like MFS transporter